MRLFTFTRLSSTTHTLLVLTLFTMHFWSAAVAALSTAQVVLGGNVNSRSPYAVKETHFVPSKWNKIGTPNPDHTIKLKIAMKNDRFHELERHLYEGSLP